MFMHSSMTLYRDSEVFLGICCAFLFLDMISCKLSVLDHGERRKISILYSEVLYIFSFFWEKKGNVNTSLVDFGYKHAVSYLAYSGPMRYK